MDADDLRVNLAKLHAELSNAGRVDPETRRLLGEIMIDIARLIESPGPGAKAAEVKSPADRLEGIAVQFEADHPALATSIRRFVDLLGKVGV